MEREEFVRTSASTAYSSTADVKVLVYDATMDDWKEATCYVVVFFKGETLANMANSAYYTYQDAASEHSFNTELDYELEPDKLESNDGCDLGEDWVEGMFRIRPVMFFLRARIDIKECSPILLDYRF